MTTFLGNRPAWLGGTRSRDSAESPWRNVPTISVIGGRRGTAVTPLAVLLILVVLVEVFAVQYVYRDNVRAQDNIDKVLAELEAVQTLAREQDDDMAAAEQSLGEMAANIQAEIGGAEQRLAASDELTTAFDELGVKTDWAGAIELLLQADQPGFSFLGIAAAPDSKIDASGIAADVVAIGRFQDHVQRVADTLNLVSLQLEIEEEVQVFSVEIQVK